MPRMEISIFEGDNPRWWVRKCERMFEWYDISKGRRVSLAITYFNDVVDAWYQGWTSVRNHPTWGEFADKLCERFGERSMFDIVKEFNKLIQVGELKTYLKRFDKLISLMSSHDPHFSEAYFVSSFLSGLSEDLRPMVKMIRPQTVGQAVESARLQEMVVEALMKKQR